MPLKGLLPEEQVWLQRKVAFLGGLAPALRFLLRRGMMCDFVYWRWAREKAAALRAAPATDAQEPRTGDIAQAAAARHSTPNH